MKIRIFFLSFFICLISFYTTCTPDTETKIINTIDSFTFDSASYTLIEGDSQNIILQIHPATAVSNLTKEDITIKIEDEEIITVDIQSLSAGKASIKIKAKKIGTTDITVSVKGFDKTAKVQVMVKAKDDDKPILITSINLDKTELIIGKGKTAKLTATISPDNTIQDTTIIWSSSDEKKATVDNKGEITAKEYGELTITATAKANKNITATCKVAVPQIVLDNTELIIGKGRKATLTVTIEPMDALQDKTIIWSSSDEAKAIVDDKGEITAKELGELTITATAQANENITATCKVKVARTEAKITEFFFVKTIGDGVTYTLTDYTDTLYAIIDEDAKTILLKCAYLREISELTSVIPSFSLSDGATVKVGNTFQENEKTSVDFSKGTLDYVVTAEDGATSQTYKVTLAQHDYAYIPDENFRDRLKTNYASAMTNGDSMYINDADIMGATNVTIVASLIEDATGIEFFKALDFLNLGVNTLTSIDVNRNTTLTTLYIDDNELTSLDVSKNKALEVLWCGKNSLTSLDIRNNVALIRLNCSGNQITDLDVGNNTALTNLNCGFNKLTDLDVSNNTALTKLECEDNKLVKLDIRGMRSIGLLNFKTGGAYTSSPIETLLVHTAIQLTFEMADVKGARGNKLKISTYSALAGSTNYAIVCCDYDPGTGTCTTNPKTDGTCP